MMENFSFFLNKFLDLFSPLKFWDGILICALIFFIVNFLNRKRKYRVTSVSVNLPFNLGNITYEPTEEDRIVAWKLYTQLKTRKAALFFDENQDVIAEVYDSLYELFPIARDLLMSLHIYEIERSPSIAELILRVQNDGLRPHLTKWQSDFRRWWDKALANPKYENLRPQDIQKKFPKYDELIGELKEMNVELNKYAEDLENIAKTSAEVKRKEKEMKPKPVRPSGMSSKTDEKAKGR